MHMKKVFYLIALLLFTLKGYTQTSDTPHAVRDYCIPGANCSYGDGFTDFAFAGIENYGSGCSPGGYGDFTDMTGSVEIGNIYTAIMATGYNNQQVSMWVDFNDNEVFDDFERLLTD